MPADDTTTTVHKKRKHDGEHKERSPKKPKKDGDASKPHKSKSKSRARSSEPPTEFRHVHGETVISIPPAHAGNPTGCANEMLDSMLMRYIPALGGVMLSHSDLRFLQEKAAVLNTCPFAVCTISFRALVWGPTIGMKLRGKISICSPDHISLLVHRTFNVSIPRHHIPTDEFEFEWGQAPNDPEFGGDEDAAVPAEDEEPQELDASKSDRWVRRDNGELLGDGAGHLDFTVVGLKLANNMLSLVGSIQADPFSPAHVPVPAAVDAVVAVEEQPMDVDPPAPPKPSKKDKKRKAADDAAAAPRSAVVDASTADGAKKKKKKKDKN